MIAGLNSPIKTMKAWEQNKEQELNWASKTAISPKQVTVKAARLNLTLMNKVKEAAAMRKRRTFKD